MTGETRRVVALDSAARTASGDSGELNADADRNDEIAPQRALFVLDVTAAGGTGPTLDVVIEAQDPASGAWVVVASFAQKAAAGREAIFLGGGADNEFPFGKYRLRWTIAGTTPTFTFSVGAIYIF